MNKNLSNHISGKLNQSILNYRPLSGGDISKAFLINTYHNAYFLKTNSSVNAISMFYTEKRGLETIAKTNTIAIPQVIDVGIVDGESYLLLEYIKSKSANEKDLKKLGYQLANLHLYYSEDSLFGFEEDNLIGSLPQSNKKHANWTSFYIEERMLPQLELATSKNLLKDNDFPDIERIYKICNKFFKNIKPSILHGDLWSGNYLIASNGIPYLIDPAIYYGHNEVDIAMSKLFGGFSNTFYNAYQKIIPFDNSTNDRIDIYQLYYLLVHLNLFGSSYYDSVKRILDKYFN